MPSSSPRLGAIVVDRERLASLVERIIDRVGWLDGYAALDADAVLADRRSMGDLKYTFQTAIEACIDASMHVVASEQLGETPTSADGFRRMSEAGVLDSDLAAAMAAAVGFRNVLVHGYAAVDDVRVIERLAERDDLRRFAVTIADLATS